MYEKDLIWLAPDTGGGTGFSFDHSSCAGFLDKSILMDVKSLCNVDENDSGFNNQLIPLVNGQLMNAHLFGVGKNGFTITGENESWRDFLGDDGSKLAALIPWVGYTVLLMFDPPDNGSVLKSYQDQILKFEWLLRVKTEHEGHVKNYVPEQTALYDELYDLGDEDD